MPDYAFWANYGHLRHLHLWQLQLFKNLKSQQPSREITWTAARPQTPPAKKITQNVLGTKWVKLVVGFVVLYGMVVFDILTWGYGVIVDVKLHSCLGRSS